MNNYQTGRIFEQRIQASHIHIAQIATGILVHIFGQIEGGRVTLLTGNEFGNLCHLGRIDKGALHTHRIGSLQEQHIAPTNELIGARTVENGS